MTSTPRPRTKRVSAQHTLERVRNNQRRHRARRKDYIATLEQKLGEAKQTISTLRDQVEALQVALTRYRRQPHGQIEEYCRTLQPQQQSQGGTSPPPPTDTLGELVQDYGVLTDTEDLGAWEPPAPASTEPLVSDDQPGSEVNAVFSLPAARFQALTSIAQSSEFIPEPPMVTESASNQAGAESGSLLPDTIMQDQILNPTTPCCSNDPSSDSQPAVNTTNRMTLVPSQEGPLLPGYVLQSAMEASYQPNAYGESTMLCSEAYILVARQNFKGMNHGDVDAWLWNGFRRPLQPGEGCRVNTDMLFSLLAFISDT